MINDEIRRALDQLTDGLNPTTDEREDVERVLVELIKSHGFKAAEAYELLRTLYWSGWNDGWSKGYRAPRADHGYTLP